MSYIRIQEDDNFSLKKLNKKCFQTDFSGEAKTSEIQNQMFLVILNAAFYYDLMINNEKSSDFNTEFGLIFEEVESLRGSHIDEESRKRISQCELTRPKIHEILKNWLEISCSSKTDSAFKTHIVNILVKIKTGKGSHCDQKFEKIMEAINKEHNDIMSGAVSSQADLEYILSIHFLKFADKLIKKEEKDESKFLFLLTFEKMKFIEKTKKIQNFSQTIANSISSIKKKITAIENELKKNGGDVDLEKISNDLNSLIDFVSANDSGSEKKRVDLLKEMYTAIIKSNQNILV